jgi:hypothetical protein
VGDHRAANIGRVRRAVAGRICMSILQLYEYI